MAKKSRNRLCHPFRSLCSGRNDFREGDKTSDISLNPKWNKNRFTNEIFDFDIRDNKPFQSVVFNSGQKMELRAVRAFVRVLMK